MRKRRLSLFSLFLAFSLLLSGCSVGRQISLPREDSLYEEPSLPVETPQPDPQPETEETGRVADSCNRLLYDLSDMGLDTVITPEIADLFAGSKETDNADRRQETGDYTPVEITVDPAAAQRFLDFLDADSTEYEYSELYALDQAMAMAESHSPTVCSHEETLCPDGRIPTAETLYRTVQENNRAYLAEDPQVYALPDELVRHICSLIVSELTRAGSNMEKEDRIRIGCALADLTIVGIDSASPEKNPGGTVINAMVTSDGCMLVDEKQIETLQGEQAADRTYCHEIQHIFQRACPPADQPGYTAIGCCEYWDELAVNSLHWRWLYEAAAELNVMREYGCTEAVVYTNMVGYLKPLEMIAAIRPGTVGQDVEFCQYTNDPEAIFSLFQASIPEEREELIDLLYAIDYVQLECEDFLAAYERVYGPCKDPVALKQGIKQGICKTLTKYFYSALTQRILESSTGQGTEKISLQGVFWLINVFEADMNWHLSYDDADRWEKNQAFVTGIPTYRTPFSGCWRRAAA